MFTLESVIYRNKEDNSDLVLWNLDIPQEALEEIEGILARYSDTGCSIRGTAEDIRAEIP